jgi:hypothetical protein
VTPVESPGVGRRKVAAVVASLALVAGAAPAGAGATDESANVHLLRRFRYPAGGFGTDTDFHGRFAYGGADGETGGLHIFDISGRKSKEMSFLPCPGTQNDVAVVRPGLVALGFHWSKCARVGSGVQLIDVRNPRRPRLMGAVEVPDGGTHTLTVYPGKPIIYSSNSGAGSDERIIDARDPNSPRIVERFDPGDEIGCHDVSFWFGEKEKLAFCAGSAGGSQIWDVSDPFRPRIISTIANPLIPFHHSVAATSDGKYLAIGDETFATCSGASLPRGAVWFYDIHDRKSPALVGYFGLSRDAPLSCTAHNFEFVPGTRLLVSSWFEGGMNVIDVSDPSRPKEVAHFQADGTSYWSAFWHDGRVYASGTPGIDVFKIDGVRGRP